jgi:hypothetical protein
MIIDGINYAAYKETDSSLHDSDKNRLFGSERYTLAAKSSNSAHGPRAISRKKWRCYSLGERVKPFCPCLRAGSEPIGR